jgi:orotate phosphoribosyltransferase
MSNEQAKAELLQLLKQKSVFHGDFTLSSGATSKYYIDCRLTTMDGRGAWLVGLLMHSLIRREEAARGLRVQAIGGLTMGADPIALATAIYSQSAGDPAPLRAFSVRKAAKAHGQTKLIEGNFSKGDSVCVIDDVVTKGDSTIAAINSVNGEAGRVAFVAVLVDRQQGGREKIEAMGYRVVPLFTRDELVGAEDVESVSGKPCAVM